MAEADVYKQLTYIEGVLKYKRHVDSNKLAEILAQSWLSNSHGEANTVEVERNDKGDIIAYNIKRCTKNKKIIYISFRKRDYKGGIGR